MTTGAAFASVFQLATPVSTSDTLTYSTVQISSVIRMPNGKSRCGLATLFGGRRDRIEADVGEEHDGRAGDDARRNRSA